MLVDVYVLDDDMCKDCKLIDIEESSFYADDSLYDKTRYCIHRDICKNAVNLFIRASNQKDEYEDVTRLIASIIEYEEVK